MDRISRRDRWIGVAGAVMWTLHRSAVVKRELSADQWVSVPTLTYGHKLWVVTESKQQRVTGLAEVG